MFKRVTPVDTIIISKNNHEFKDNNIITDFEFWSFHNKSTPGVFFTFECIPGQEYIISGNIKSNSKHIKDNVIYNYLISASPDINHKKIFNRRKRYSNNETIELKFKSDVPQIYIHINICNIIFNVNVKINELKICPINQPDLVIKSPIIKEPLKLFENNTYNCLCLKNLSVQFHEGRQLTFQTPWPQELEDQILRLKMLRLNNQLNYK